MSIPKKIALIAGDILILYLSLALMLVLRYKLAGFGRHFQTHFWPFSLIFIVWLVVFYLADLYRQRTLRSPAIILRNLLTASFISGVISVILFYLFGGFFQLTPKTNLLIFAVIFLILDFIFRRFLRNVFTAGALGTAVIGDSGLINETVLHINENPQAGYKITAHFRKASPEVFEKISKLISRGELQLIVVQPHLNDDAAARHFIYQLLPQGVNIMNFWNFYEMIFEKVPLGELQESWFVENIATRRPFYDATKRLMDFLLALISGLIFLVFATVIALIIKITSRGPAVYKQQRIGKNGKIFTLYKFRTMYHQSNGPYWTTLKDKRITPFGKFLRFTHLDEIPQLWNILKGDISFIGPRPERSELAENYKKFPHYEIRHVIKPGLTGWAQINYRPSASLEEAFEKLRYDIYYIKNRSIFLDVLIVLKTLRYVFTSHS